MPPLLVAIKRNRPAIVDLMLEEGADVNILGVIFAIIQRLAHKFLTLYLDIAAFRDDTPYLRYSTKKYHSCGKVARSWS